MSNVRRSVGFAIVALISLVLPMGVVCWSAYSFFASAVESFDIATLKNGDVWYSEWHATGVTALGWSEECSRVKCINLATGIERLAGLELSDDYAAPFWVGDDLYLVSSMAVFQRATSDNDGRTASSLKMVAPFPVDELGRMTSHPVFLFNGELTTVVENREGHCRLAHLRDGRWVDGRKIRLPPENFVWTDQPDDGRKMLQPAQWQAMSRVGRPYSAYVTSAYVPTWRLEVRQAGEHFHLFYSRYDDTSFTAYRDWLEFDDDTHEGASALAVENAIRDANGWEPIEFVPSGYSNRMLCDRDGALFRTTMGVLVRRSLDGVWSTVRGKIDLDSRSALPRSIVDVADSIIYVVGDSGEVLRIDGDSMQPTNLNVPDSERAYLARWKWLLLGLVGAWLLHYLVVAAGTSLLTRNVMGASYEFGIQRVILASTARRGPALAVDLAILALTLSLSLWAHCRFAGMYHEPFIQQKLIGSLVDIENTLSYPEWDSISSVAGSIADSILEIVTLFLFGEEGDFWPTSTIVFIIVLIDTGFVLWLLKVYDEGRYGSTPGKWLLGIRTMRTTLRQSGFARALVRDVLLWVDLLGFVTPLPAAASIVFSPNRQRWGDRVADTIVINANSINYQVRTGCG